MRFKLRIGRCLLEKRSSTLLFRCSYFLCAVSFLFMEFTPQQPLIHSIGCVSSCKKPWNRHGAWFHPNCHIWVGYATLSWVKNY
ncbi:putative 12.8 kDa protein in arn-motA intergenic region [Bienertia sinuspersici]